MLVSGETFGGPTRLSGSPKCLRGPFYEGRDKICIVREALKFGVIFQKIAFELLKYENFGENFRFCARCGEK